MAYLLRPSYAVTTTFHSPPRAPAGIVIVVHRGFVEDDAHLCMLLTESEMTAPRYLAGVRRNPLGERR